MKFSCDSCSAQYKIGDDKLGRRGVKVRCKRCGTMIVVRPGAETTAESTASAPPTALMTAGDGLAQEFSALGFDEAARRGGSVDVLTRSAPAEDARTTQVVAGHAVPASPLEADLELSRSEPAALDGREQGLGPAKPAESHPSVTAQSSTEAVIADLEAHRDAPTAEAPSTAGVQDTAPGPARASATAAAKVDFDALSQDLGGDKGSGPRPGHVRVEPFGGDDDALNPAKLESELQDEAWAEPPPARGWTHGGADEDPWAIGGATWSPAFGEPEVRDEAARADGDPAGDPMPPSEAPPTGAPSASPDAASPPPVSSDDLGDAESSVEAEIGHAFAAMFDPEATPELPPDDPAGGAEPGAPQPPPLTVAPSSLEAEWYVAVAEEQVGPLTRREVEAKWASGTIDSESLCWRQGRPDWAPIGEVAELADLVVQPSAKPSPASSAFGRGLTGEIAPAIALAGFGDSARSAGAPAPRTTDGWRPSAASALATLAAEEFAEPEPEPARPSGPESERRAKPTTGRMTALPTANGELSRLIEGHGRAEGTASMFGLAEKSVSKVRAIPRRAETLAAAPLADVGPPPDRRRKLLLGAAVLGGVLVAGGAGAALFGGSGGAEDPSPGRPVAEAAPKATEERPGSAAVAVAPTPSKIPPVVGEATPPVGEAGTPPVGGESASRARPPSSASNAPQEPLPEPVGALAAVRGPDPARSAASPKPGPNPPAVTPLAASSLKSTLSADAPSTSKPTPARAKPKPVKKKRRRAASRQQARRSSPSARTTAPEAPKKVAAGAGGVDDLLAAAGKPRRRRRSEAKAEPQLPTQLDETEVFRVLRRHKAEVRDCITQHQAADGPKGRVRVSLDIRPSGRVAGTKLSPSRFAGSVLGRCLSGHARGWKFPRFKGSTTPVDFPVTVK